MPKDPPPITKAVNRPTGKTRRRWLFFTQYQYEGPVYRARWQSPYNTAKWPRATWWSYRVPTDA